LANQSILDQTGGNKVAEEEWEWIPDIMEVKHREMFTPEDIWTDHESLPILKQTINNILAICADQKIVLDADKALIEPIMEKWEKDLGQVDPNASIESNAEVAATPRNLVRPIIGQEISNNDIEFLKDNIHNIKQLKNS